MEQFKKPLLPACGLVNTDPVSDNANKINEKEQSDQSTPPQNCPYKVPIWSSPPENNIKYDFEILKSGQIISEINDLQKKAYWTFGRLPENDIEMAHPTISRYHAILQYRPKSDTEEKNTKGDEPPEGWYIYDMDSTHGTFVNKQRVPPRVYIRIRVGHILRLGASTRSYILQGPTEDEEPESEFSITELKVKKQQEKEEAALKTKQLEEEAEERARNEGCSWGMGDDADEETDLTHNPYAATNNEELFLDDPKKTLRGYFEREGLQLEYKCDEMSAGSFVCRVELPLDNENGRPIIAEVVHKGKKKECVVQCALEACRILDRHGVLRQANQEPLRRKQKQQGSDSEEDEFWDRTGDVAKKKQRKTFKSTTVTFTYEDLLKQESDLNKELELVVANILSYQEKQKQLKAQKEMEKQDEDLDSFMENLKEKEATLDKTEIKKLRFEEQRLKTEIQRTKRLIDIAKPVQISLDNVSNQTDHKQTTKSRPLPMIGKRNQFSKFKICKEPTISKKAKENGKSKNDHVEEDDDSDEYANTSNQNNITLDSQKDNVNASETHEPCKGRNETDSNFKKSPSAKNNLEKNECKNLDLSNDVDRTIAEKTQLSAETSTESCSREKTQIIAETSTESYSGELSRKKRQRNRQRGKRQEVDVEDEEEYESSDKYAKWVPPENQTGDGFTELNKKFGY